MKKYKFIALFLVFYLIPGSIFPVLAAERLSTNKRFSLAAKDVSSFENSFIQNLRLIQKKQELQFLEDQANFKTRGGGLELISASNPLLQPAALNASATLIYNWISENQKASPLGLVASYPNDAALTNQAFTYDQALSGLLLLQQADTVTAKKIFDFYNSQWDGSGFWTVYNTQSVNGSKVEYDKIMGPNAWIALFALKYYSKTGDANGLDLATKVGKWIKNLPHRDGGSAMGSNAFWSTKYSVENNLNYYAVLKILAVKAAIQSDRQLFVSERNGVKNWLKTQAYDAVTGLFKRGAYGDNVQAIDTNTWAILVIGTTSLKNDFGIDVNNLVSKTEATFSVQSNGSFGHDTLTAKGFDFSDYVNASTIGRSGLKWVEGTNHFITAYKHLERYYSRPATLDTVKAAYYHNRAVYFANQNVNNRISDNNRVSYYYTDQAGAQVYADNPYWRAASGSSVAASAWVYYSIYGLNPFI